MHRAGESRLRTPSQSFAPRAMMPPTQSREARTTAAVGAGPVGIDVCASDRALQIVESRPERIASHLTGEPDATRDANHLSGVTRRLPASGHDRTERPVVGGAKMSQRPPNSPLTPASARARSAPSTASGWTVDSTRLWRGAVPAALVGALVAVVGLIVIRDLLGVPVLRRTDSTDLIQASTLWYIVAAAVAAVVATGLLHLLLRYAPRPFAFYGWLTRPRDRHRDAAAADVPREHRDTRRDGSAEPRHRRRRGDARRGCRTDRGEPSGAAGQHLRLALRARPCEGPSARGRRGVAMVATRGRGRPHRRATTSAGRAPDLRPPRPLPRGWRTPVPYRAWSGDHAAVASRAALRSAPSPRARSRQARRRGSPFLPHRPA